MQNSTRTIYNAFIGYSDEGLVFLDDTFYHGEGFYGATGYILVPVSKEEYDARMAEDVVREYIREATDSKAWADEIVDDGDLDEWHDIIFDESFLHHVEDVVRDELGFDEDNFPAVECIACGRIFSKSLGVRVVHNLELVEEIAKYEDWS